jgi:hypothetical protein
VLLPKLVNEVPPGGRMKCYPIPTQECTTNGSITCPVLTG